MENKCKIPNKKRPNLYKEKGIKAKHYVWPSKGGS
jgi:hypothetical protein